MPVKVIKYTCKFKCGRKASTLADTLKHEGYCFKNPENKACAGCKYFKITKGFYEYDEIELPTNSCELKGFQNVFDGDNIELYRHDEIIWTNEIVKENCLFSAPRYDPSLRIFPRINCPDWEPKTETKNEN